MRIVGLVLRISVRSLIAHRVKTMLVGALLAAGTFLVVFFGALMSSVEESMRGAITESYAGDLQVYSSDARDALELFGSFRLGSTDIGEIPDFHVVEQALTEIAGVRAVIPMAITDTTVFGRNEIDNVNEALRVAIRAHDDRLVGDVAARAHRIVTSMAEESDTFEAISNESTVATSKEALAHAVAAEFWVPFEVGGTEADRLAGVDYLDSKIAPLATDGRLLYLRMIGTDLAHFTTEFDRFYVVKGTAIPTGEQGVLLSDRTYEQLVKNQVVRQLDVLREAVVDDGESIAADPLLQQAVRRMVAQYKRITFSLAPADADEVVAKLGKFLGDSDTDLENLVRTFLTVDDATIAERHAFFYEVIAPKISLYDIPIGSTVPLRGFTKSGYIRSVNARVWGTYEMRGLEKAGLEQASNLTDLATFRELYGKMSAAQIAELEAIRNEVGVADVARDDVEAMLFGGGAPAVPVAVEARPVVPDATDLVLNAAVLLDDPGAGSDIAAEIERVSTEKGLGLKVVDWQSAAGMLGQFISVVQLVLVVSLGITGLVTLIIVNNAVVMSTLDRVPEIGTIRALGGQRGLVVAIVLTETALLAVVAGVVGATVGVLAILQLGKVGIPATADVLTVLFAGDRLYPTVGIENAAAGLLVVAAVALVSTLYPAVVAAAVPPVVAMRGKE